MSYRGTNEPKQRTTVRPMAAAVRRVMGSRLLRTMVGASALAACLAAPAPLTASAAPVVASAAPATPATPATTASMVADLALTRTSSEATATGVGYRVTFVARDDQNLGNGTVTLQAPTGVKFPTPAAGGQYLVTDETDNSSPVGNLLSGAGTDQVTLSTPNMGAGDQILVKVDGVTNPTAAAPGSLLVSTNNDPSTAAANDATTSPLAVGHAQLTRSSPDAGATAVAYRLAFVADSGLSAADGSTPMSTITVAAPLHTVFASGASYVVTDLSSGASINSTVVSGAGTNQVLLSTPNVSPGDQVLVAIDGVTNPSTATSGTTLSVETSSDPVAAAVADVTTAATPVGQLAITQGSTPGTYVASFVSAGMTAPQGATPMSTITLTAPPGTEFPAQTTCSQYQVTDVSSGATASCRLLSGNGTDQVTLMTPDVGSGDWVSVSVAGVTSPAAPRTLTVTTTSNPVAAQPEGGSPSDSVGTVGFTNSSPSAGGSGRYQVRFTATHALSGAYTISLTGPAGTTFPASNYHTDTYYIDDLTTGAGPAGGGDNYLPITSSDNEVNINAGPQVNAGDQVLVTVNNVTNPGPAGAGTVEISTSSDAVAVSRAVTTTSAAGPAELAFTASSSGAGATHVSDQVRFTATGGGLLYSIGISGPANMTYSPSQSDYYIEDLTTGQDSGGGDNFHPTNGVGTNQVSISSAIWESNDTYDPMVSPGDMVLVTLDGVTNPANPQSGTLTVSPSWGTGQSGVTDVTTAASAITRAALTHLSGDDVTEQFRFVSTSALASVYDILLDAPAGTVFPPSVNTYNYTIDDLTTGATGTDYIFSSSGNNQVAIADAIDYEAPDPTVGRGDQVLVTIVGVANSETPGATDVSTTSDRAPVAVMPFQLTPIRGTVTNQGIPVAGAAVQACTPDTCASGQTASDGTFTLGVTQGGSYTLTAYAPPTGVPAGPGTLGPLTVTAPSGISGLDVKLGPAPGLRAGVTIDGTQTSSTGTPVINWQSPSQVTMAASDFPAGNTLITQLNVTGLSETTGQLQTITVAPGGSADGVNIPVPAGTPITVPALAPIHGAVSITADYLTYSSTSSAPDATSGLTPSHAGTVKLAADATASPTGRSATVTPSPPPGGIAMPSVINFSPPGTVGNEEIMNVGNVGIYPYTVVTLVKIIGPNAADFQTIDPKDMDQDNPDCAGADIFMLYTVGGPGNTVCSTELRWTPNGTSQFEHAYAVVSISPDIPTPPPADAARTQPFVRDSVGGVTSGSSTGDVLVPLLGCSSACPSSGNDVAGGGGVIPPDTYDDPGDNGSVSTGSQGAGDSGDGGEGASLYVDPSGIVQTHTAAGNVPLAGASVTLQQGTPGGPFTAVPNGSAIMSPANQANPSITGSDGSFGWDTVAGTYDALATDTQYGCTPGEAPAPVTVPPPATFEPIVLSCSSSPSLAPTTNTLTSSANPATLGSVVTLTASVTGTGPTGTVAFADGANALGTAPVDPATGQATLTLSNLAPGSHELTAAYSGDGANASSTSGTLVQVVTAPPAAIFPAQLPTLLVGSLTSDTLTATGLTSGQVTMTESGALPSGVAFVDNGDGTASLSGTPAAGAVGSYPATVTASNGAATVTQTLTLTVTAELQGTTGWTLGGSAQAVSGGAVELTPAATDQAGSVRAPTAVSTNGLAVSFTGQLSEQPLNPQGADGMTLTLASPTSGAFLGGDQGGLGYTGIDGVAICLVTHKTNGPSNNFIGIADGETAGGLPEYVATATNVPDLRSLSGVQVTATVSGNTLTVDVNGQQVLQTSVDDMPATAVPDFTASTGLGVDQHVVSDVVIR